MASWSGLLGEGGRGAVGLDGGDALSISGHCLFFGVEGAKAVSFVVEPYLRYPAPAGNLPATLARATVVLAVLSLLDLSGYPEVVRRVVQGVSVYVVNSIRRVNPVNHLPHQAVSQIVLVVDLDTPSASTVHRASFLAYFDKVVVLDPNPKVGPVYVEPFK